MSSVIFSTLTIPREGSPGEGRSASMVGMRL
jgi:hypothetical protein